MSSASILTSYLMRNCTNNPKIFAERTPWHSGNFVDIYVTGEVDDKKQHATGIKFEPIEPGICQEPIMRIGLDTAQVLMDQLWGCGLRPTEGSGSAGSLAATERHLKDMREIAFHKLGIKI